MPDGGRPADAAANPAAYSVLVRVAAAAAATAAAGRRPEATEVGGLPCAGGPGREGHEALELGARALGAAYPGIGADELLELGSAGGAAIVVDGHGRRLAPRPDDRQRPAHLTPRRGRSHPRVR
jgi:hypothetical protein